MPSANDPRVKDYYHQKSLEQALELPPSLILQGYPDDEAIANGGGRTGAKQGPAAIRQELLRLTPALFAADIELIDIGDVQASSLADRHSEAQRRVRSLLTAGHRMITLGGGHDYGYADGAGFLISENLRPLVLNFDAHLDMRDPKDGMTSGTPFFRLCEQFDNFDFAEIGIQSHCNAKAHLQNATAKGCRVLTFDEWILSGRSFHEFVLTRLESWLLKPRPTYLSLDMDVFGASAAPGCSAAQPLGLTPHEFYPLLLILLQRLDVRLFGVYETSPPLDRDNTTSKLAAHLIHRFLYAPSQRVHHV